MNKKIVSLLLAALMFCSILIVSRQLLPRNPRPAPMNGARVL